MPGGYVHVSNEKNQESIFTSEGKQVYPYGEYEVPVIGNQGYAWLPARDGNVIIEKRINGVRKMGIINQDGILVQPQYSMLTLMNSEYAWIGAGYPHVNSEQGVLRISDGKEIIPQAEHTIKLSADHKYFVAADLFLQKQTVYDLDGNEVDIAVPPVEEDKYYFLYINQAEEFTPPAAITSPRTYYQAGDDTLLVYSKKDETDNQAGFTYSTLGVYSNKQGNLLEPIYRSVEIAHEGKAIVVTKDNEAALYDAKGEEIIPFGIYKSMSVDYNSDLLAGSSGTHSTTIFTMTDGALQAQPYTDADVWAQPGVKAAIDKKLVPEALQSFYQGDMTRKNFCMLAVNLYALCGGADMENNIADISFGDTNNTTILKAAALGIVKGFEDGSFYPNQQISREDAAVMLERLLRILDPDLKSNLLQSLEFTDESQISDYAKNAVSMMSSLLDPSSNTPIMQGNETGAFLPKENYTRQQSYLTFLRAYHFISSR